MKRMAILAALLLLPLLLLAGCGSSDTSSPRGTGSLKVAALFPDSGRQGAVGPALLDTGTARIRVEVVPQSGITVNQMTYGVTLTGNQVRSLTPQNPSTTISGIPVGPALVLITTFDASGNPLDQLTAIGMIQEGSNTLTATMLRGTWTFGQAIPLNKTMAADTTQLTRFSVLSPVAMKNLYNGFRNMTTMNQFVNRFSYYFMNNGQGLSQFILNPYGALFEGNFSSYTTACRPPMGLWNYSTNSPRPIQGWKSETMCGSQVVYENYFKGTENLSGISVEQDILLKPDTAYPRGIEPYEGTNRRAFILGIYSSPIRSIAGDNATTTFSDSSILTTVRNGWTRPTAGNALSGTIIETLTKWYSSSRRCYDGATEVSCYGPQMAKASAAKADAARKRAILSRLLQRRMLGVGAAAADAQGCYRDLNVKDISQWTYPSWQWDPVTQQSTQTTIRATEEWEETVDACITPFTATGAQISQTALGIADQVAEFFYGQQMY